MCMHNKITINLYLYFFGEQRGNTHKGYKHKTMKENKQTQTENKVATQRKKNNKRN